MVRNFSTHRHLNRTKFANFGIENSEPKCRILHRMITISVQKLVNFGRAFWTTIREFWNKSRMFGIGKVFIMETFVKIREFRNSWTDKCDSPITEQHWTKNKDAKNVYSLQFVHLLLEAGPRWRNELNDLFWIVVWSGNTNTEFGLPILTENISSFNSDTRIVTLRKLALPCRFATSCFNWYIIFKFVSRHKQ